MSYRGEDLSGYDAMIPRIASYMTRYGTAIVRQMEMQGVWTISSSIAITRSRDKLRSTQLLARAGVGILKTVFSRNSTDIDDLDRKSTRLNSSHLLISYAVFCLKKKSRNYYCLFTN